MTYLDYNATTPLLPSVLEEMLPYMREDFGNPSSQDHRYGLAARNAIEDARAQVSDLLGGEPQQVIFTSGATEGNNLAINIFTAGAGPADGRIAYLATEHPSVRQPAIEADTESIELPVDELGVLDLDQAERLITEDVSLVCVMAANNETGAIQPIESIGLLCDQAGARFHVDMVQTAGRIPFCPADVGASSATISGHKMYGPKGVGALWLTEPAYLLPKFPIVVGGGQEYGLRSGTLNTPGIVGLGAACTFAAKECGPEADRERGLRDNLIEALEDKWGGRFQLLSPRDSTKSLPQTVSIRIAGISAAALTNALNASYAFSRGSACASADSEPSHVLLAMGLTEREADEVIRVSFGYCTTEAELRQFLEDLNTAIDRLHELAELR